MVDSGKKIVTGSCLYFDQQLQDVSGLCRARAAALGLNPERQKGVLVHPMSMGGSDGLQTWLGAPVLQAVGRRAPCSPAPVAVLAPRTASVMEKGVWTGFSCILSGTKKFCDFKRANLV